VPAQDWIEGHGAAADGASPGADPPVRVALRGPVVASFTTGSGQVGWRMDGSARAGGGVRLSRCEEGDETRCYAALPGPAKLRLEAVGDGTAQVLVRAGEGRLLDYDGIVCLQGDSFELDVRPDGGGVLTGAGQRVAGRLYDLADEMRNEEVLLAQPGHFDHVAGGGSKQAEIQVTVPKPGLLKVIVTTPGPFQFGQSGASCRCDRIERLVGDKREPLKRSIAGGDWKASPVVTTTTANVEQPGAYVLRVVQAVCLSPTWGDVMTAPAHDYEVKVTIENLQ